VIVQLSKYVWAVVGFGGVPSGSGFAKRFEIHCQPKKMNVDGTDVQEQYGCINFHAKHYVGHGAKLLTLAVKNKWASE
jgi:hypothetical protein